MFEDYTLVLGQVTLGWWSAPMVESRSWPSSYCVGRAYVSKVIENYFVVTDPYFKKAIRQRILSSTASNQGSVFEQFMMTIFSGTFYMRPLSEWPHQPQSRKLSGSRRQGKYF